MDIKGRDLVEGVPKTLTISDKEIRERSPSRSPPSSRRCAGPRAHASRAVGRHHGQGHRALGGGALLRNLDQRLRDETGLPVVLAEDPLASVVLGTGRVLEDIDLCARYPPVSDADGDRLGDVQLAMARPDRWACSALLVAELVLLPRGRGRGGARPGSKRTASACSGRWRERLGTSTSPGHGAGIKSKRRCATR